MGEGRSGAEPDLGRSTPETGAVGHDGIANADVGTGQHPADEDSGATETRNAIWLALIRSLPAGLASEHRIALACAAVALGVGGLAVVATLAVHRWQPSILVRMSVSEPIAELARATDLSFAFVNPSAHYDGVYFYAVARDPLALGIEHDLIDKAAYRYGHPGYGWLAWLLSFGQPRLVPLALLVIGLASIATAAAATSLLSKALGWSAWGGLVVPFNPGLVYAVTADTSEPVGAAALGLTLLAWLHGRRSRVAGLLILLCLIKEIFLVVPLGLAAWEAIGVIRRRTTPEWRHLAALLPGPFAFVLWQAYVRARFGVWSFSEGEALLDLPLAGWSDTFSRAAAMGTEGFDQMQLGQVGVPLLAVTGAVLATGLVRALQLRTFLDPVYILFALSAFCLNWLNLLYPKDLIRALAIPLCLLPAALLGPGAQAARVASQSSEMLAPSPARWFGENGPVAIWRSLERGAPWLWPYGVLATTLGLLLSPLWTTADKIVAGGDAVLIYYPWEVLWRDALAAGEFPFWNPYTFSGVPAFAHPQTAYAYQPRRQLAHSRSPRLSRRWASLARSSAALAA